MTVLVEPDETAARIREYVRANPDLVHDDYADVADPLEGACYVLSESYFHASGGTDSDLDIYCLSWQDVDPAYEGTHWYLRRRDGPWVDLGLPERGDAEGVPFDAGTRRAFITGYEPSQRTERVLDALGIDYEAES
jgi:hypothetical protein